MPFNGAGGYSPPGTDFPAVGGTLILSTKYNNVINDLAVALSICITRDGQQVPTANLPMGGFRHTGVGNSAGRTDYAATGQVQDSVFLWCGTAGGTADALTLTCSPAIAAYAAGQRFIFKSGASPNTGAITIAVSGLPTKAGQSDGAALIAAQIEANKWYQALYDGAAFQVSKIALALASSILPAVDTQALVKGSADGTKQARLEADGITAGALRVITLLDADIIMVGSNFVNVWSKEQHFPTATLTDGASIALDLDIQQNATVTLGGNRTLSNPSNKRDGQSGVIRVKQDATGSRTLAWGTDYKFYGGVAPVLTTTANALDLFSYHCDGTNVHVAPFSFDSK